jgi:hypothetical protein
LVKRRRPAAATSAAASLSDVIATRTVAAIPVLLTLRDMAAIYRVSVGTIRRGLQAGTFRPIPWDKYPYRWNPSDVERDLETRRDLRMRDHGRFNKHRLRSAKVESPSKRGNGKKRSGGSSTH